MNITITGKGMNIGEQLHNKVVSKLSKFNRYFGDDAKVSVKVRPEGDDKCMEITIRVSRHIYRSEAVAGDVFTALDLAMAGMERQIRKQKSKIEKKIREYAYMKEALQKAAEYTDTDCSPEDSSIIKHKQFELAEMTADEAALQMELIGHSFHLFLNFETGKVALVYKRKDGNYGLIEPTY